MDQKGILAHICKRAIKCKTKAIHVLFFSFGSILPMKLLTDMLELWIYHMQCRLSATIRCLSHPSAHVRALSISVLRDILHTGSIRCSPKPRRLNGTHNPSYQYFNLDAVDWQADIEKCLTWEAHSRLSNGLSINFLDIAAKELGCTISMWNEIIHLSLWQFFARLIEKEKENRSYWYAYGTNGFANKHNSASPVEKSCSHNSSMFIESSFCIMYVL